MDNSLDHVACQSKNVQIIGSMQPRKRSASASSEIIRMKGSPCASHPRVQHPSVCGIKTSVGDNTSVATCCMSPLRRF